VLYNMQGKEPWNKGKEMSLETRARMSAAKLGRRHTRATRRQMSQSHAGLSHSLVGPYIGRTADMEAL